MGFTKERRFSLGMSHTKFVSGMEEKRSEEDGSLWCLCKSFSLCFQFEHYLLASGIDPSALQHRSFCFSLQAIQFLDKESHGPYNELQAFDCILQVSTKRKLFP